MAAVILITLMTHVLIADFSKKSVSAMIGTIGGVVVAGVIALVFGKAAHITGYNVDDIETLVYIGQNSRVDIGGMLFSGIIIPPIRTKDIFDKDMLRKILHNFYIVQIHLENLHT